MSRRSKHIKTFSVVASGRFEKSLSLAFSALSEGLSYFSQRITHWDSAVMYFPKLMSYVHEWGVSNSEANHVGSQVQFQKILNTVIQIINRNAVSDMFIRKGLGQTAYLFWAMAEAKIPFSQLNHTVQDQILDTLVAVMSKRDNAVSTTVRILSAIGTMVNCCGNKYSSLSDDQITACQKTVIKTAMFVMAEGTFDQLTKALKSLFFVGVKWNKQNASVAGTWENTFVKSASVCLTLDNMMVLKDQPIKHFDDHPKKVFHELIWLMGQVGCEWIDLTPPIQKNILQIWTESVNDPAFFYSKKMHHTLPDYLSKHHYRFIKMAMIGFGFMNLSLPISGKITTENMQRVFVEAFKQAIDAIKPHQHCSLPIFLAQWSFIVGEHGFSTLTSVEQEKVIFILQPAVADKSLHTYRDIFKAYVYLHYPYAFPIKRFIFNATQVLVKQNFTGLPGQENQKYIDHTLLPILKYLGKIKMVGSQTVQLNPELEKNLVGYLQNILKHLPSQKLLKYKLIHNISKVFGNNPSIGEMLKAYFPDVSSKEFVGEVGDQLQALCLLAKSLAFSHQSADIIQSYLHQGIVAYQNSTEVDIVLFAQFLNNIFAALKMCKLQLDRAFLQFVVRFITTHAMGLHLNDQKSLWVGLVNVTTFQDVKECCPGLVSKLKEAFINCFRLLLIDHRKGTNVLTPIEHASICSFVDLYQVSFSRKQSQIIFKHLSNGLKFCSLKQVIDYFNILLLHSNGGSHENFKILINRILENLQQQLKHSLWPKLLGVLLQQIAFYFVRNEVAPSDTTLHLLQHIYQSISAHVDKFTENRDRHRIYLIAQFFFNDASLLAPFAVGDYYVLQLEDQHPQVQFGKQLQKALAENGQYLRQEEVLHGHPYDFVYECATFRVVIEVDGASHEHVNSSLLGKLNQNILLQHNIALIRIPVGLFDNKAVISEITNALMEQNLALIKSVNVTGLASAQVATSPNKLTFTCDQMYKQKIQAALPHVTGHRTAVGRDQRYFDEAESDFGGEKEYLLTPNAWGLGRSHGSTSASTAGAPNGNYINAALAN